MMKKVLVAAAATTMIAGAALAAAPVATAATPRTTVDAWYADFLGREADEASAYWVDRLGAQAPGDVLWALAHTDEYNTGEIADIYDAYLDRGLDPGASYWINGANAGSFPIEWAEQNVLASDEFARNNPIAGPLVSAWYADLLGREARPDEVTYWGGRAYRAGRLQALRELWYAPEAVTYRVTQTYERLLDREPRTDEIAYWSPKEIESDINVQVLIASTPEYADLAD